MGSCPSRPGAASVSQSGREGAEGARTTRSRAGGGRTGGTDGGGGRNDGSGGLRQPEAVSDLPGGGAGRRLCHRPYRRGGEGREGPAVGATVACPVPSRARTPLPSRCPARGRSDLPFPTPFPPPPPPPPFVGPLIAWFRVERLPAAGVSVPFLFHGYGSADGCGSAPVTSLGPPVRGWAGGWRGPSAALCSLEVGGASRRAPSTRGAA